MTFVGLHKSFCHICTNAQAKQGRHRSVYPVFELCLIRFKEGLESPPAVSPTGVAGLAKPDAETSGGKI